MFAVASCDNQLITTCKKPSACRGLVSIARTVDSKSRKFEIEMGLSQLNFLLVENVSKMNNEFGLFWTLFWTV
jgi:uncharacterized protein (UPF0128 family)